MVNEQQLKGISMFVAVAEAGSFTAAAERMNLTNSAVSKSVARLEARLQTKLFDRTTRRLALTDAGQTYYRTCNTVLADLKAAETAIQLPATEPCGRVRIDMPASYGRLRVLPEIIRFIGDNRLVMPHITMTDRFVDQVEEGIDILVRIGGPQVWPGAVERRLLGTQQLVFCASEAYLQEHGEPATEQELQDHGCVLYAKPGGGAYALHFPGSTDGDDGEQRIVPGRITIGHTEGQLAMVLAGLGIAQLPLWLVADHLDNGRLVQVLPHLATEGLPISIAWLKNQQHVPKIHEFVKAIYEGITHHTMQAHPE